MARNFSAGTASVDITVNFDGFVKKLRAELERVDASIGVDVFADTTRAREDIAELRQLAEDDSINIEVDVDTTRAAADLEDFRQFHGEDITIGIDVDTAAATTESEAFRRKAGQDVKVKIDADKTSLSSVLSQLPSAGLLNAGAIGVGNLPAAATALAGVASSVQQVSQSALLLPGIFAGAGAGISTLVVGMQGFKDALGDSPEKAAAAYGDMAVSGREVVDVTRSFSGELKSVRQDVQGTLFDGVAAPLREAITNDIPAVRTGMEGVAGSFNTGIKAALAELGNQQSQGALSTLFGNTAAAAGNLNGAISPVIDSLRILGTTGSAFLPELAQDVTDLATRFDGFIGRSQQSGDLAKWMREGIDAAKTLGSTVENLGSSLASVLRAAKGDGDGLLTTVDHLTERMSTWLKSTEGQDELTAFFQHGRDQLDQWKPVLEELPGLLHSVYDGVSQWSSITMPFLRTAATLLGEHPRLVGDVVTAYLAFKTVSPVVDGLKLALRGANSAVGDFRRGAADAAESGAGRLGSKMGGVSTLIGSALGGPWGLAIGAATIGLGALATAHEKAREKADAQKTALEELGRTLDETTGKATEQTVKKATQDLERQGDLERAQGLGFNTQIVARAAAGVDASSQDYVRQRATSIIRDQLRQEGFNPGIYSAQKGTGLSEDQIISALAGDPEAVKAYARARGGDARIPDLSQLKKELPVVAESAATLGGNVAVMADKLGSSAEGIERQNQALGKTHEVTTQGAKDFEALGISMDKVTVQDGKTVVIDTPTDEQRRKVEDLGRIVETLPDKSIRVELNDDKAKTDLAEIMKPETKQVTVEMFNRVQQGIDSPEARKNAPAYSPESGYVHYALGGALSGGIPGKDSIPILGMPGEHMLTTGDVQALGGQAGVYRFRAALKAGLVRGMASGGAVDDQRPTKLLPQTDLPGYKSQHQIQVENAQDAVDQANTKRNRVYADPNATDNDKRRADNDYLTSQRQLRAAQTAGETPLPEQYAPSGILQAAGGLLVAGALGSLGLGGLSRYTKDFGAVVDFYGKKDKGDDTTTGYTPKNLPVQDQTAAASSSSGGAAYSGGGVEQWRPTFSSVLSALGMPSSWIGLGMAQMQTESGGNPKAINLSDSNAAKGTPSKGLMQVIDPTFASYRSGLYPNDIWEPNANIAAALRYTVARYGSPEGVWGQGHGYADGGWITGIGGPRSDSNRIRASVGEFMVNASAAAAHGPLLEAINAGIIPAPSPLPQGMTPHGGDAQTINNRDHGVHIGSVSVMDMGELVREQDRWAGIQAQGALAAY
ncbi:transglycosylase SLT domain-containing protein [Nocardia sp. NRRL WC-3656]|uniref:lytic transglycosylase domain-containing protein n=1 Tax=Nocardia sp. NRRL WC-3656 TaxID=1463824 RepID=UPI0004C2F222|nr:transglycosylase SLT domain-containing protein [Nocardia sp. NRRL WC-3656]